VPRRRRRSKRRQTSDTVEMFVIGDGVVPFWAEDPVLDDVRMAKRAWNVCRASAWRHPARGIAPPVAAVVYDSIGKAVVSYHPARVGSGHRDGKLLSHWSPAEARRRLAADVASVESFRQNKPEAAKEIADELDEYVMVLGMLVEEVSAAGRLFMERYDAWTKVEQRFSRDHELEQATW